MPKANLTSRGVDIFYELHCSKCGTLGENETECGCKHAYHILLVMGFQARGEAWKFNLDALLSFKPPGEGSEDNEVMCCWLDNRGVGESSHPQDKKDYSTTAMADDALALMDRIGWDKAHIFGHSMGGMICCKIASRAPDRIYSMALLGVTGGGSQAVKSIAKRLPGIIKHGGGWAKTTEQKARATLYFHFSRKWLKEEVEGAGSSMSGVSVSSAGSFKSSGSMRRKEVFLDEYMKSMEEDKYSTAHGANGQANAVLNHSVTNEDIRRIKSGGFPISVVHGRKDVIAGIKFADKLARKLGASFVVTDAGHFITRESLDEVNHTLLALLARVHNPPPKSYWGTTIRQMKTVSKAVSAFKAGSAAVMARVSRPSLDTARPSLDNTEPQSCRASKQEQTRPAAIGNCAQEPLEAVSECREASDGGAAAAALPSEGQEEQPLAILKQQPPQLLATMGPDSPNSSTTSPVMAVPPDASAASTGAGTIDSSSTRVATLGVVEGSLVV